jgi:hypothetical protein
MPTTTASLTIEVTPTSTPTIVDTPSPTAESTAVPSPNIEITITVGVVGINPEAGSSLGLMPYLVGIAAFLAILGGIFLYLGRQS